MPAAEHPAELPGSSGATLPAPEAAPVGVPEPTTLPAVAVQRDVVPTVVARSEVRRPSVLGVLWYSVGGRLAPQHHSWVLHDVTCRTWALRHLARTALVVVPLLTAYLLLTPASWAIRLLTGLTFAGGVVVFSLVNILVETDRRAVRAGYPVGLPSQLRSARSNEHNRQANFARRERIAARQAKRRR